MSTNVPAPIPRVSRFGLIHSVGGEAGVRQFMNEDPSEGGPNRWEDGFQYTPESCTSSGTAEDPCGTVNFDPDSLEPREMFNPYLIHEELKCSTIGNDAVGLADRTRRLLTRTTSRQVEEELWLGTRAQASGWSNPYLTDANLTLIGEGLPFLLGLAHLQEYLADCLNGIRGMLHMNLSTASKLFSYGALYVEANLLVDAFGNIVVPGVGYPHNEEETSTTAAIIGTGMVSVRLSDISVVDEENTRIDAVNNLDVVIATRMAAATWDCCQLGVTIDICTPNCTAE